MSEETHNANPRNFFGSEENDLPGMEKGYAPSRLSAKFAGGES